MTGDGGYGLNIVDKLSDRWGVKMNGCARVWLEIDREPARPGRFTSGAEAEAPSSDFAPR